MSSAFCHNPRGFDVLAGEDDKGNAVVFIAASHGISSSLARPSQKAEQVYSSQLLRRKLVVLPVVLTMRLGRAEPCAAGCSVGGPMPEVRDGQNFEFWCGGIFGLAGEQTSPYTFRTFWAVRSTALGSLPRRALHVAGHEDLCCPSYCKAYLASGTAACPVEHGRQPENAGTQLRRTLNRHGLVRRTTESGDPIYSSKG